MSWEIQGRVESPADVDRLVAAPTQDPNDAEAHQVDAIATAIKDLLDADVVSGALYVRAGGHANEGGGPAEGQPHEMVTLTIDFAPDDEITEDPAVAGADETVPDDAETAEAPAQGEAPPAED